MKEINEAMRVDLTFFSQGSDNNFECSSHEECSYDSCSYDSCSYDEYESDWRRDLECTCRGCVWDYND